MAFNAGQILVFDRAGQRIGVFTKWAVSATRTYRLTDTEDFNFYIPLKNQDGTDLVTAAVDALAADDNLIYVENEMAGIPGWGGAISSHNYGDERLEISCLGGASLLTALQTDRLTQSGGSASQMASRLVAAANAKKGAHGDLHIGFVADDTLPRYTVAGSTLPLDPRFAGPLPLYGTYDYTGDIYQGLTTLAQDTLGEFWIEPILGAGGLTLDFTLHWDRRVAVDHTALIIEDGAGGALKSGAQFLFSGLETLNHIRLKGAPTNLAQYLDYDCIKAIVKDISPEVEETLDLAANVRRREDTTLTVNFGLSDAMQQQIAATGYVDPVTGDHLPGIQETYLGYYKSFLYAYHNRQGKPFLEGYDWGGLDDSNSRYMTERTYRTWNKMGRIKTADFVLTSASDGTLPDASIENWQLDVVITPVADCVGVALDWGSMASHWIADGATGNLVLLEPDNATQTIWGNVSGAGALLSVATDPSVINEVWVLLAGGIVQSYDIASQALLAQYNLPAGMSANDIAIDGSNGLIYVVGPGSGTVNVLDLNSGSALTPSLSFASGFSGATGISLSGGLAYVANAAGVIRMLFLDGTFAGSFTSGVPTDSLYVDLPNRRIWVVDAGGSIKIYHAYVAIGVAQSAGGVVGAPGFDQIHTSQFVHIVMHSRTGTGPAAAHAAGTAVYYTVRAPIGTNHDSLWKIAVKFYGNGSLWRTIWNANRALIGSTPALIYPGQVFRIPNKSNTAPVAPSVTKYYVVYTRAHFEQYAVPGPIGQPDQLLRSWVAIDDTQHHGLTEATKIDIADSDIVVGGEEGRVCDWNPTLDGYGLLKEEQKYRTRSGHTVLAGHGWYPVDWDVPDRAFEPPPKPPWPEGTAYALDYLAHRNRGVTVQTIAVTNKDGLWGNIELGGVYTLHTHEQGPRPSGLTLMVRVLAFSPKEPEGEMELVCEVY